MSNIKATLFLIPAFKNNRPQSIRFQNLIPHLESKFNHTYIVLYPSQFNSEFFYDSNKNVLIKTYSTNKIWIYLNQYYYPNNIIKFSKFLLFLRKYLRAIFKYFIFPDLFILEKKAQKKEINKLHCNYNIECIIISSAPHSQLSLSKYLKKTLKIGKLIYDIGDPLYNNAVKKKNAFKNIFYYLFEKNYLKYVDFICVTNQETKAHYLNAHKFLEKSKKVITVIPMGGNPPIIFNTQISVPKKTKYHLVYAGIFYKKLREPFNLFNAIEEFNQSNRTIFSIDIYGDGMEYYKKLLKNNNYVSFKKAIPHNKILSKYLNYDFIVHIDNAYGLQTPGKNFELLLTNLPVLFIYQNTKTTAYEIFAKESGVVSAFNNKQDIYDTLKYISENVLTSKRLSNPNIHDHSWKKRAELFQKIID